MRLDERIQKMRQKAIADGNGPVPSSFQGVGKERIHEVLETLDLNHSDIVDAVFALLDPRPSWFGKNASKNIRFSDAATTAHVACHVGILQRGVGKLDREGRDYWLKPLREIGGIEAVYFDGEVIVSGHPVSKSPNSAYRLEKGFLEILKAGEDKWKESLSQWIDEDVKRARLALQAEESEKARRLVDSKHVDLIRACCEVYAPRFLPGFQIVFVDDADGNRISTDDQKTLQRAGLVFELDDAMPDVLMRNTISQHI